MILDPAIRDWVLLPIMVVMLLVGIIRHHISVLITGAPKKPQLKAVRESKALLRGSQLRSFRNAIPPHAFESRKAYLTQAFEQGKYLKNPNAPKEGAPTPNPMTDPDMMEGMMEGMKKQVSNMVPQMLIMGWINFFFQGFVVIKLPFPLTLRFKSMLQSGVDTRDMDVTWVSSLSWYFLNLFAAGAGMNDMAAMGGVAGMAGMAPPGQPQDFNKIFLAEKENLLITSHDWELNSIEEKVLKKYGKSLKSTSSSDKIERSIEDSPDKKEKTVKDKIRAAQKAKSKRS
ncbi:hypothetical protein INT43_002500 [Umbelopsis isabellina]|uniref:ER membrane protein complex subunit 3 n=1 Tax=Mortierella isabellina TaxID=91625 RepID=A0A8H7Q504_MORIS|nr:hypothetical protein INT43_002500 [Umbelopsis isabellina]